MSNFTAAQLQELEVRYGLVPAQDVLPIRDGVVRKGGLVWWRCNAGPQHVNSNDGNHWKNIKDYPELYSIAEPKSKVEYLD